MFGAQWKAEDLDNDLLLKGREANRVFGKNLSLGLPQQSEWKVNDHEEEKNTLSLTLRGLVFEVFATYLRLAGQEAKTLSKRTLKGRAELCFWQLYGTKQSPPSCREPRKYPRISGEI